MTVVKSESAAMHFTHMLVYDAYAVVYLNTHTTHMIVLTAVCIFTHMVDIIRDAAVKLL